MAGICPRPAYLGGDARNTTVLVRNTYYGSTLYYDQEMRTKFHDHEHNYATVPITNTQTTTKESREENNTIYCHI